MHKNRNSYDYRRANLFCGNRYCFYDTYIVGECFDGRTFTVDLDDYDKISKYLWSINSVGYVCTNQNGKTLLQHRLIMDVVNESKICVDHINFNTLDNRKCNLRLATKSQNCCYQKNKRTKYGIVGVHFDERYNRWYADITKDRKTHHLGSFKTFDEAAQARLKAEQELHGEFGINLSTISNQAANSGRLND